MSESLCLIYKTTYRSYSEGDDVLLVSLLQDNQPAVLLIRPVPAVDYLVTPPGDIDTLAVTAGELLLPTPGELERGGVGPPVVTGRAVPLHHPAGSPQHQRVEPSVRRPRRLLLLTHHAQLPHDGRVVEADLGAGDADIDQLGGVVVLRDPVGVDVRGGTETSHSEVDLLPPLAGAVDGICLTNRAFPIEPASGPVTVSDSLLNYGRAYSILCTMHCMTVLGGIFSI